MVDIAVVGGGIVGCAVAAELAARCPGREIVLVEKEPRLAAHQSSHNSGEIPSGIYYKPGSLKAKLSVEGSRLMKEFCRDRGLPIEQVGKVIVATREDELPRLEELYRRGLANGVPGVELIGPERLREIEPHATGLKAVRVPGVAITDFGLVARELARKVPRVLTGMRVRSIRGTTLYTSGGEIRAGAVITCAGLHSDRLARAGLKIVPFRGEYAEVRRRDLIRGLIYPAPDPRFPFLGIHFTKSVYGPVEAGPNAVLAFAREGYRRTDIDWRDVLEMASYPGVWRMAAHHWSMGLREFYRSLSRRKLLRDMQRLVPEVREDDLLPGRTGVRAQALERDGTLVDDFRLVVRDRVIHVVNAPSPAATASLAIAKYVVDLAVQAHWRI
jgi:L-2-hydroxyglutarate oxidase LhgO